MNAAGWHNVYMALRAMRSLAGTKALLCGVSVKHPVVHDVAGGNMRSAMRRYASAM